MSKKNRGLNKLSLATLVNYFRKKFGGKILRSEIKTVTEILEDQTIFKSVTGIITILYKDRNYQLYDLSAKIFINPGARPIIREYYYELHDTKADIVVSKKVNLANKNKN